MAAYPRPTGLDSRMGLGQVFWLCVIGILVSLNGAESRSKLTYRLIGNCSTDARHISAVDKMRLTSLDKCQQKCSERPDCKAVNWRPPRGSRCQLYKTTVGVKALNFIPRKGWQYKEKSHSGPSQSCSDMSYRHCNPRIKSFSNAEHLFDRGNHGSWGGRDVKLDNDIWYYMVNYDNEKNLYVYPSLTDAKANTNYQIIRFVTGCSGSQYVVYDGLLFCKQYNSRNILIYSTINGTLMKSTNHFSSVDGYYAGQRNNCHFRQGHYTDIAAMADESGIYFVWGRQNDGCRISVSRLNMDTLTTIDRTWHLPIYKLDVAQAMMRCGRLYMTYEYNANPNWMRYIWDMRTGNLTGVQNSERRRQDLLYVVNWSSYMHPWQYNPRDGLVYHINNPQWHRQRYTLHPDGETNIWPNY